MKHLLATLLLLFGAAAGAYAEDAYLINPGDVLQVFVWNEEALSREVLVQPDGDLRFPMVGRVKAGGSTADQVEARIVEGLATYLKDKPVVTVSLLRIDGNKIYVLGNVARPGEYVVNRRIDVMQALALAGGLNSFAAENDIVVLRRGDSATSNAIRFKYASVKQGNALESNIVLRGGDTVVVP